MPDGLGYQFNLLPTGDGVEVNVKDCATVTFIGVLAGGDTYTLQECTDAAGTGAQNLACITRYYTTTSAAGAAVWLRVNQAAAATVVTTIAVVAIPVNVDAMSDGFTYLRMTSTSTGLVIPILHDLKVRRDPRNLPAVAV
jgi:hypothetical protein